MLFLEILDDLAIIDKVILKGKRIIVTGSLKQEELEQLCSNHTGVKVTPFST